MKTSTHQTEINRKPVISMLFFLTALFAQFRCAQADTVTDAHVVLDWLEQSYPEMLTPHKSTTTLDSWLYRSYTKSDIYVGINKQDNGVYYISGAALKNGDKPIFYDTLPNVMKSINKDKTLQDGDGFIDIKLSASRIFIGGALIIQGESGNYNNLNAVDLIISGPGVNSTHVAHLDKEGKFTVQWYAVGEPGKYKISCSSSDKKASTVVEFTVEAYDELDEMASDNIQLTQNLMATLNKLVNETRPDLSTAQTAEVDKQIAALNNKVEQLQAIFGKLNDAGKAFSSAAQAGEALPEYLAVNLSQLKQTLQEHQKNTQKLLDNVNHKTIGYTICETLEMVNEACAAFSTVFDFTGKLKSIAKNLALDKAVPTAATMLNEYAFNKKVPNERVVPGVKFIVSAAADTDGLTSGTGPMGIAGDVAQLYTTVLMKALCGSFEGTVNHDYLVDIRNKNGQTWWKYGYSTAATLTLRYPKSKGNGKVVPMKGHIEGNATKFSFYQNVSIEDEFMEISKGRVTLEQWRLIAPIALPFATSDIDKPGFGMFARAIATPSYFNLPVDATYDKDAGSIRLFFTEGGIDFSPLVKNRVLFVSLIPLPLFKIQDFPIIKAKDTMNAVIKRYGEYKMIDNGTGGLSFSGNGTHHAGSSTSDIETTVNLSVNAKQ